MLARLNRGSAAVLAGMAASLLIAVPAMAQTEDIVIRGIPESAKVERVTFHDLNLRYIAHLNILNERVGRAVRHVCEFGTRDEMNPLYKQCADASWAAARPQIHQAYVRANQLAQR